MKLKRIVRASLVLTLLFSFVTNVQAQKITVGFESAKPGFLEQLGRDLQVSESFLQSVGAAATISQLPVQSWSKRWPAESSSLMQVHLVDDRDIERVLVPRFLRQSGVLTRQIPAMAFPALTAGDYQVEIQVQSGTVLAPLPDCSVAAGELDLPLLCPDRVETQWKKDNWVMLGLSLPSTEVRTKMKIKATSSKWYLPSYENEFELNVFGAKLVTEIQWSTQGTTIEALNRDVPVSQVGRVEIKDIGLLRTIYNLVLRGKLCGSQRCPEAEVFVQQTIEQRLAAWIKSEEFAAMIKDSSKNLIGPAFEKFLRFEQIGLAGEIKSLFFETVPETVQMKTFFSKFGSDLHWNQLVQNSCVDQKSLGQLPSARLLNSSRDTGEVAHTWIGSLNDPSRMADFMLGRKLLQQGLEAATLAGTLCGKNQFKVSKFKFDITYHPTGYPVWNFGSGIKLEAPFSVDFGILNKKEKKILSLNGITLKVGLTFVPALEEVKGVKTVFLKIQDVKIKNLKFPRGIKGMVAKLLFKARVHKEVKKFLQSDQTKVSLFPSSFEIFSNKAGEVSSLELMSMGWVPENGITLGLKANHR